MPQVKSVKQIFDRELYSVIGLPFDAVDLASAKQLLYKKIEAKEKCFLSTPNLNFAIGAHSDQAFYRSVAASDLCIADGMPIVWFSKIMGVPINARVAGSDLFEEIVSDISRVNKVKIFFFGGEPGAAKRACERVNEIGQGAEGCGYYDPGFVSLKDMSSKTIIEHINACKPDFLLVALGAKKGQEWIVENIDKLDVFVVSHLGAVINFASNRIKRSPRILQKLGLEWVWRIYQEPILWRRYFKDGMALLGFVAFRLIPLLFYQKIFVRAKSESQDFYFEIEGRTLVLRGSIGAHNTDQLMQAIVSVEEHLCNSGSDIIFDCSGLTFIDASAIAYLQVFNETLTQRGKKLFLVKVSRPVKKLLNYYWVGAYILVSES